MSRDKSNMPTIAEAGPIGARKTRAVASGYREKVTKIQKAKITKRDKIVGEVSEKNRLGIENRATKMREFDESIAGLTKALDDQNISGLVRESLEEQLADAEYKRSVFASSPVEVLDLPEEESRIIPEKGKLLESVEQEATSREATAGELFDIIKERGHGYGSLEVSSARAINEIFLTNGKEGKGIDQLLMEQYISHPEMLSDSVKQKLKTNIDTATRKLIDAELAQVGHLDEATLQALRKRLEVKYQKPEKVNEVIVSISDKPKKSILDSRSIDNDMSDLLIKEAVAQGADLKELAVLLQLKENDVASKLGIRVSDTRIIFEAVRFFTNESRNGNYDSWQFQITNPETKAVLEKVLGYELYEDGRLGKYANSMTGETFRDQLLAFSVDINKRASGMVETAKDRILIKKKLGEARKEIPQIEQRALRHIEEQVGEKLEESQELILSASQDVSMAKERTVQLEHRQKELFEEAQELIDGVRAMSVDDLLASDLPRRVSEFLGKLNSHLEAQQFNDVYYKSLTDNMRYIGEDTTYQQQFNGASKPLLLKSRNFLDLPKINLLTEQQMRDVVAGMPDVSRLTKVFTGGGLEANKTERDAIIKERQDAGLRLQKLLSSQDGVPYRYDQTIEAMQKDLKEGLAELFKLKLKVGNEVNKKVLDLQHVFDYVRKEKFSPIWEKLNKEKKDLGDAYNVLSRERYNLQEKMDEFEESFMGNFTGFGAGGADRKRMQKIAELRTKLGEEIGVRTVQLKKMVEVFEAMDPVLYEFTKTLRTLFPDKPQPRY